MKRFINLFIAIWCGFLLWAAWPPSSFSYVIFIAWLPLLWLEATVQSRKKFFGLTYITMLVWNVATTWWIWNASPPGAVSAFVANSLLMCFPWLGFTIVKKWKGEIIGYVSLIAFWMCFEYIHLQDWGLSWPWLTLGNVFASNKDWVQWYEYTGTSGGTLWILVGNIIAYSFFTEFQFNRRSKKYFALIAIFLLVIILPPISFGNKNVSVENNRQEQNTVIVQPNIDPYEKISTGTFEAQLQKLISLSEKEIDSNTALLVWPETALYMGSGIDEGNMKENFLLNPLWGFLKRHPKISLFTGVESFRLFDAPTKQSQEFNGNFYESYNGSALLDSNGATAFYHKSMLVPGVETLPWFLKFIDKWFEKFGGTTAGYARQKDRTVLNEKHGYKIAPAICYESIYGEYMSRYVRNGANLICIITNDGWWKKTPGHKQHNDYARLRAIETRSWVARSANTGISCFIDPYGNVIEPQPYNTSAAIKISIPVNNQPPTFFVKYGDILSKIMIVLSIVLIVWITILKILSRFKRHPVS